MSLRNRLSSITTTQNIFLTKASISLSPVIIKKRGDISAFHFQDNRCIGRICAVGCYLTYQVSGNFTCIGTRRWTDPRFLGILTSALKWSN